jgi:uncharacterized protein involved in exopolysaccharide biosynthesis
VEREITLKDYGRVLWRGRWLILATTLVAAVVGLLLTFASDVTYTGKAQVFLGQATTSTGAVVATPDTSPEVAPTVLDNPELAAAAAKAVGVSPGRISRGITVSTTRVRGVGNVPTVATITMTDEARRVAREGANAYAEAVLARVSAPYEEVVGVYERELASARRQEARYAAQITGYERQLQSASADRALALQGLLLAAVQQQSIARDDAALAALNIAKAQQLERPEIIDAATGTTSSGAAPQRARTVLLAAVLGLIIGIVVAFVWRGPAVGRDASGPPAADGAGDS